MQRRKSEREAFQRRTGWSALGPELGMTGDRGGQNEPGHLDRTGALGRRKRSPGGSKKGWGLTFRGTERCSVHLDIGKEGNKLETEVGAG